MEPGQGGLTVTAVIYTAVTIFWTKSGTLDSTFLVPVLYCDAMRRLAHRAPQHAALSLHLLWGGTKKFKKIIFVTIYILLGVNVVHLARAERVTFTHR
jgi:hypothetical protein